MTNHWVDIKNANVVMVMGGNPAEAHPCGFKWVVEAKAHNKAKLIVVDPRFTRTAAVADIFAQIRPGADIAFLGGVIKYLLDHDAIHKDYVVSYTNAAFIVKEGYRFEDGLFSGYDEAGRKYDRATWTYEMGADGFAKVDPTLQDPRCVYQLMKKHFERYTPKMVAETSGVPENVFGEICKTIATTAAPTGR
jgi:formate dehydrogenase major subunit